MQTLWVMTDLDCANCIVRNFRGVPILIFQSTGLNLRRAVGVLTYYSVSCLINGLWAKGRRMFINLMTLCSMCIKDVDVNINHVRFIKNHIYRHHSHDMESLNYIDVSYLPQYHHCVECIVLSFERSRPSSQTRYKPSTNLPFLPTSSPPTNLPPSLRESRFKHVGRRPNRSSHPCG